MTKRWKIVSLLTLLWWLASGLRPGLAEEPKNVEIAAWVNEVIITRQAVERAEVLNQGFQRGEPTPPTQEERRRKLRLALERLIDEELLYQEAVARGIKIEKKKIHQVIRQMKETMPGAEFSQLVVAHWAVKDEIVKTIERNLMIQRLIREAVLDKVEVSEEELLRFYEEKQELFRTGPEVRLQQILLFAETEWQAELMRNRAEELATRARNGEDFVTLARAHSQGPARDRGGDLGWRSVKHLPQELRTAVGEAAVGTTIDPVQIPRGLVIAKVLAKRPSRVIPFSEVRDHLERTLREGRLVKRREAFIQGLRSQATIEVFLK